MVGVETGMDVSHQKRLGDHGETESRDSGRSTHWNLTVRLKGGFIAKALWGREKHAEHDSQQMQVRRREQAGEEGLSSALAKGLFINNTTYIPYVQPL